MKLPPKIPPYVHGRSMKSDVLIGHILEYRPSFQELLVQHDDVRGKTFARECQLDNFHRLERIEAEQAIDGHHKDVDLHHTYTHNHEQDIE